MTPFGASLKLAPNSPLDQIGAAMTSIDLQNTDRQTLPVGGDIVDRQAYPPRLWHWTNVVTLVIMLMSRADDLQRPSQIVLGQIRCQSRPRLAANWRRGRQGLSAGGRSDPDHNRSAGALDRCDGRGPQRAFPYWATLPQGYNLALARRWHLTFAWVFAVGIAAYLIRSLWNRQPAARPFCPPPQNFARRISGPTSSITPACNFRPAKPRVGITSCRSSPICQR